MIESFLYCILFVLFISRIFSRFDKFFYKSFILYAKAI